MKKSLPWLFALLVLVVIGAAFRLWGLTHEPLWLDEAYSAYAAGKGWAFLWQVVPRYETHPPFYYSLLRGWTLLAGDGLAGVRSLGVVAGIATLPVLALAGKRIRGWPVALAAVLLGALWPLLIEMAREVRPYPLMILTYAGATLTLLAARDRVAAGRPLGSPLWVGYIALLALMLWLHNLGTLYAAALGLSALLLIARRSLSRTDWLWLIGGHAIAGLLWLPALAILIDQAPTWISSTWLTFDPVLLPRRLASLYASVSLHGQIAAALLAILGVIALSRLPEGKRTAGALLILALLPVALSVLISATVAPVFIVRTMTAVAAPTVLLLAAAFAAHGWWRWAALVPLAVLVWTFGSIDVRARQMGPMQDWYAALDWLAPRFRPGDVVYAYPNEGALPFDRAVRDRNLAMPSRAIPAPIPALSPPPGSWYVSGSRGVPSLDRPHLAEIAQGPEARAVPTIWLLRLGPWAYDKGDVLLKELERDRTVVGRYRDGPIDIVGLRRTGLR